MSNTTEYCMQDNPEDRDAESRVNAVKGLVAVCETLTYGREQPDTSLMDEDFISIYTMIKDEVMTTLFKVLDDYSIDNRGDVGSWVREAAMDGLEKCTCILCKKSCTNYVTPGGTQENRSASGLANTDEVPGNQICKFFDVNLATNLVRGILKQAVEKMDKLRETAAKTLQRILYSDKVFVPFIPNREKLEEIIPNKADLKWAVSRFHILSFLVST